MRLNELRDNPNARKSRTRVGRGIGSGKGKTAGRGHKGQKSRSGVAIKGFEGGQMPIYRRLPKRGFSNAPFKTEYAIVTTGQIAAKFDGEEVNRETLVAKGLLSGKNKRLPIKILLKGDLTKAHTFMNIEKFSKTAADAVAKAGGKIESKEVSKEA